MISKRTFEAVAWVPTSLDLDWDEASLLGASWTNERGAAEDACGLLITNGVSNHFGIEALDWFAGRHEATSRRSRRRIAGTGPVLSYVPEERDLDFAQRQARRSSICVIEGSLFPIAGWAAYLGATNLATGSPTEPLDDEMLELIEHLRFIGNNGFGDDYGKRDARRIRGRATYETEILLSALMGAGCNDGAIRNLRKIIDAL